MSDLGRGLAITRKMIADMEKKLQAAIEREDWAKAADLDSYIGGMRQIETVFSLVEYTEETAQ